MQEFWKQGVDKESSPKSCTEVPQYLGGSWGWTEGLIKDKCQYVVLRFLLGRKWLRLEWMGIQGFGPQLIPARMLCVCFFLFLLQCCTLQPQDLFILEYWKFAPLISFTHSPCPHTSAYLWQQPICSLYL